MHTNCVHTKNAIDSELYSKVRSDSASPENYRNQVRLGTLLVLPASTARWCLLQLSCAMEHTGTMITGGFLTLRNYVHPCSAACAVPAGAAAAAEAPGIAGFAPKNRLSRRNSSGSIGVAKHYD